MTRTQGLGNGTFDGPYSYSWRLKKPGGNPAQEYECPSCRSHPRTAGGGWRGQAERSARPVPGTPDAIRPARSDDSAERIADSRTGFEDRPEWLAGEIRPGVTP